MDPKKTKVSYEVDYTFTLTHLMHVWPWIRKMGFNSEDIAAMFWKDYGDRKEPAPATHFLIWGVEVLQPMLNQKLGRPADHPTFIDMMEHVMAPFIKLDGNLRKMKRDFNEKPPGSR